MSRMRAAQVRLPEEGLAGGTPLPGWKRVLDLTLLVIMLPAILLLSAAVAVWIRLVSRGPVLFCQKRLGHLGRTFNVLQFRTLEMSPQPVFQRRSKTRSGPARYIFGGRMFKAFGLNALPQVLNVLRGEMSLVGPRACLPSEAGHLQVWEKERFNTPPGLTGQWQVSGQPAADWPAMVNADLNYCRRRGPALDCLILLFTFPARLQRLGQHWRQPPADRPPVAPRPRLADCHSHRLIARPFNSVPVRLHSTVLRPGVRR